MASLHKQRFIETKTSEGRRLLNVMHIHYLTQLSKGETLMGIYFPGDDHKTIVVEEPFDKLKEKIQLALMG